MEPPAYWFVLALNELAKSLYKRTGKKGIARLVVTGEVTSEKMPNEWQRLWLGEWKE